MATRWGVTLLRASVFSPSEDEKHQRYTIDIQQNSCLASGGSTHSSTQNIIFIIIDLPFYP